MSTRRKKEPTAAEDEAIEDENIDELERLTAELRIIRDRKRKGPRNLKKKFLTRRQNHHASPG